ncbi:MAG: HDOD domain-containing protein [Spirochaetaceae bacterium]|nr:HDOD domain-containing protein [Spirochaetaceae bacterium]
MKTTGINNYSIKVQNILQKNNKITLKVSNLDDYFIIQMEQLLSYTLHYYKLDLWHSYFSLLIKGLLFFSINNCHPEKCFIKLIRNNKAFIIQIQSEDFKDYINKRDFIEFINDLSDEDSLPPIFRDLFFLKKLFEFREINTDNITYSVDKIELFIPEETLDEQSWSAMRDSIISSIDQFPPLKENIIKLDSMIHSGSFDMKSISEQVGTDAALTMDILKIVNSGAYMPGSRIDDINSALKYLGLRELYNLMISLSIKNTLSLFEDSMKAFWYHSYKCAYYSCRIARELKTSIGRHDSIYTSALLHDIGKFPISRIFGDDNEMLLSYCRKYKIRLSEIEDALSGIRHNETGYLMAEKWHLPDSLKLIMKYHHNPADAPDQIRNLNDIIYMADCLTEYDDNNFDLSTMDRAVLKRHKISSVEDFRERFKNLSESFNEQNLWI